MDLFCSKSLFTYSENSCPTGHDLGHFCGSIVPRNAFVVTKLINAGAIILGKASLSEWAHFRGAAPSGWCARSGQGKNPYVLSADPCYSSSGSAISVAANMVAVTLGTETDGSILCPSSYNSVVGIKPTVGLTSRDGVIPISPKQDTVGPMCRTVADAVYVLDAITMRQRGAVVVDNLKIANIDDILNSSASGELLTLLAEFKVSLNSYLKGLVASPVRSLAEVIAFNNKFSKLEKIKEYGQILFEAAQTMIMDQVGSYRWLMDLLMDGPMFCI
ncbi:hypothetical protein QYF36_009103 [Acer negundo]|nr:hypothetical protein QYF36_009103 [Acer negundo]